MVLLQPPKNKLKTTSPSDVRVVGLVQPDNVKSAENLKLELPSPSLKIGSNLRLVDPGSNVCLLWWNTSSQHNPGLIYQAEIARP